MVDFEDGEGGVEGELEGPILHLVGVEHLDLADDTLFDVDAHFLGLGGLGVEGGDEFLGLVACVFSDGPGDDLERFTELLDGVLVESGLGLGVLLDLGGKELRRSKSRGYDLAGSGAGQEAGVADDALDGVDTVVYAAFGIVEKVISGGTQEEGGDSALVLVSAHDDDLLAGDLVDLDLIAEADFFGQRGALDCEGRRRYVAHEHRGAGAMGDASELKLREDLDDHDAVLLEEV